MSESASKPIGWGLATCFIYQPPVSWASRLPLAGRHCLFGCLSLACGSSRARGCQLGRSGFLQCAPGHGADQLLALRANKKAPRIAAKGLE